MPTVNNGNVPYGSTTVTIASVAYVASQLELTQGSTILERRNQLNEPSGFVITPDFKRGSCMLQRPTSTAPLPQIGDTVTIPTDKMAGVSGTVYITERGVVLEQAGIEMFRVSLMLSV
jgi:hypothetical protein